MISHIKEVKILPASDPSRWFEATLVFIREDGRVNVHSIMTPKKMIQFRRAVENLPVLKRRSVRVFVTEES